MVIIHCKTTDDLFYFSLNYNNVRFFTKPKTNAKFKGCMLNRLSNSIREKQ